MKAAAILIGALALSACASAKLHEQSALNQVALDCGMTYGDVFQDAEEKRLLITLKDNITLRQRACVTGWARRNHLKPVFVSMETPQS